MASLYLQSPARIHFGLMELEPSSPLAFAGVGVMLDQPGLLLRFEAGKAWRVEGSEELQARVQPWVERWQREMGCELPLGTLSVECPLPSHAGFGSGTQLACGVVSLLTLAACGMEPQLDEVRRPVLACLEEAGVAVQDLGSGLEFLQRMTGRGQRSGIGMAGFLGGGWILDGGRHVEEPMESIRFDGAKVLTILVREEERVSGERENRWMEDCAGMPNRVGGLMHTWVQEVLRPALLRGEYAGEWASGLRAYGRMAGELFRSVQGGLYRSPRIAEVIEDLRARGIESAAQSSWGPAVAAVVPHDLEETAWNAWLDAHPSIARYWWSSINTTGAQVWVA